MAFPNFLNHYFFQMPKVDMDENRVELGIVLKDLLKERSLSMHKLSMLSGIDTATISRIINGKQLANINHLQKFADCLNVSIEKLLIAAGYNLSSLQQEPASNTHNLIDSIEEILKSLNLLDEQCTTENIQKELNKYEQYALTEEGKQMISKGFNEKISASGTGPFIEQLKEMYEQYNDYNTIPEKQAILGSGLLYFISSIDIIPDFIFGIGYLDDVIAIKLVQNRLSKVESSKKA